METSKLKPVLLRDQDALALVYSRARREHRPMANAAAATIIESAANPQHQSFKQNIVVKSIPDSKDGSNA
jgi:hypothetical protein